jgi:hypothetical protein
MLVKSWELRLVREFAAVVLAAEVVLVVALEFVTGVVDVVAIA